MSLSFFQGILSIGVGVTFLQKMSPPRMTPAPHDACPTSHDARPTPHDDRKGRHYYTTASQAGACVYSSDDPCGRHAVGWASWRGGMRHAGRGRHHRVHLIIDLTSRISSYEYSSPSNSFTGFNASPSTFCHAPAITS